MDIRRENFRIIQISPLKPNQITFWDRLTLKRSEKKRLDFNEIILLLTKCSGSTCWRKTRTGRLKSVQKTERRNQQWTKLTLIHYDYLIVLDNRFNIRISHLRKMAGNMAEKVYRQNGRKSLQAKNFHNKMHYALVALAYSSVKPSTSSHIKFTGNCPLESKKSNLW